MKIKQIGQYTIIQLNNVYKQIYGKQRMLQKSNGKKFYVDLANNKTLKTMVDTFERGKNVNLPR